MTKIRDPAPGLYIYYADACNLGEHVTLRMSGPAYYGAAW